MGREGPETKLVKKMREEGRARYGDDLVVTKYHGSAYSQAGVSDLLVCLRGKFGAAEVKAPESYGGSIDRALEEGPTTKQLAYLGRINAAGGIGVVVASVEGFMEFLDMLAGDWEDTPVSGNDGIVCTCTERCEYDTKDGCYYCRMAPITDPCPNLDKED